MIGDGCGRDLPGFEAKGAERLLGELMVSDSEPELQAVPSRPMERLRRCEVASVHRSAG
jgi:hypothetical protein